MRSGIPRKPWLSFVPSCSLQVRRHRRRLGGTRLSRVCGYQELVNSFCKLGAELKSIVGEKGGWAPSTSDKIVHQDVRGSFICKFGGGDSSEHFRTRAEAVRETENVKLSSGRGRQGSKVVTVETQGCWANGFVVLASGLVDDRFCVRAA